MREVFDGYMCELEDCVKPEEEKNNCAECGYCVSMEDIGIAQAEANSKPKLFISGKMRIIPIEEE